MADSEEYVEIYRGSAPVEAQMLEDVLSREGFEPRLIGTRNAALVGGGQSIFSMRIEVPASMAEEARGLVESLVNDSVDIPWGEEGYPDVLPLDSDEEDREVESVDRPDGASDDAYRPPRKILYDDETVNDDDTKEPRRKKNRILALGVVAVMPGLSQVYAGRPWSGLLLMLGLVVTLGLALSRLDTFVLGMAYLGSFAVDIVAGQKAVTAYNRGEKTGGGHQAILGIVQVAIVQLFAYGTSQIPV